tara:strand:- start:175 stop:384 length:210 start_codon:yes stop_codon:yes gene_type:complete
VTLLFSHKFFIFTTNNDVQDLLIFGHNIDSWLIYVVVFFGLTSLAFVLVWGIGFLAESRSGKSTKQPWE